MLIDFDDYPIHQTAAPLAQCGGGNPNHYDRFWFNGFREDLIFGIAFCVYPNRRIVDGAFSIVQSGRQRSVFASGRLHPDPTNTRVGPIRIEIVEPMRTNRVIIDAPEHGLVADLTYTASTDVIEEPRQLSYVGARLFMDATRATQWGSWSGSVEVDGRRVDLGDGIYATKDRSWGARSTAGWGDGAPDAPPEVLFLWAPIHFEHDCFHYLVFENPDGTTWAHDARIVSKGPGSGRPLPLARVEHRIDWATGTRRARAATLLTHSADGSVDELTLEPLATFQMKGLGYGHPIWGHGKWHDELAVGSENYELDDLPPLAPENLHVQQLVRATWRGQQGLGVLEQVMLGPYRRYGFNSYLDGAR
ncbi:hypothetical protein [Mycobacterium sp. GA-2829]|uniref:hypothetical protein n=1 Tax=Mycobacterium sp. GA-2829 TaxID=1772283 RepID=UPI0007404C44|nr:hypothetical protein [Mycobacterium sp. GA-2829]KUI34237.1 hypothetical protein AU194_17985 [Mycobacterium sp. GA-2829]